jgi:sulfur-carrier protein
MGLSARWHKAYGLTLMRILYFGATREAIGIDAEDVDFPDTILYAEDAIYFLAERSAQHKAAFANTAKLRVAIDQHMAKLDSRIAGAKELAIFPPVTGG